MTAPTPRGVTAAEREGEPLTAERSIERYDLSSEDGIPHLAPHATGTWIMYAQHLSMLAGVQHALLAARREVEAVRPYLQHRHDCKKCPKEIEGILYGEELPPHECTCGLDAALAATKEAA